MKNLIIILTILLLGITACNKSEEQAFSESDVLFQQLKTTFSDKEEMTETSSTLKQTAVAPEVGDQIIIKLTDGSTGSTQSSVGICYVTKVWNGPNAFAFIASQGTKEITVLASNSQITVNTQACWSYPANSFITYKAAINFSHVNKPEWEGIYNWHENNGCASATINSNPICWNETPEIVAFHQESNKIIQLSWIEN